MKKFVSLIIGLMVAITVNATDKVVNIKGEIKRISVLTGLDVKYVPGSGENRVEISGPTNSVVERVHVSYKNGMLIISAVPEDRKVSNMFGLRGSNSMKGLKITLYAPFLNEITVSAGARVKSKTIVSGPGKEIKLNASSGGNIELEGLECSSLECCATSGAEIELDYMKAGSALLIALSGAEIDIERIEADSITGKASSGSSIELKGRTTNAELTASSGGDIDAKDLITDNKKVWKSSAGSVSVR